MEKINTNLYSRQIYTYGLDTMEKIINLKILIIGLRGLGIEIAKNLILSGPKIVSICDKSKCLINDLGTNFYINENDIGNKSREEACYEKLCLLNPYVKIIKYKGNLKDDLIDYNIIIITEIMKLEKIYEINNICRKNGLVFIYSLNFGLTGFLFNDFGEEHIINDVNGNKIRCYHIYHINNNEDNYEIFLDIRDGERFNLKEGDYIIFKQIKGIEELNDSSPHKIKSIKKQSFIIEKKNKNNNKYINGGIILEKKMPKKMKFLSFENNIEQPNNYFNDINIDKSKKNINEMLHCAFVGLHKYYDLYNKLPELNNLIQVNEVVKICHEFYQKSLMEKKDWLKIKKKKKTLDKFIKFNETYLKNVIRWCKSEINPLCAFLGGIVSQEIVKISGKYSPINQWLRFDFFEVIENIPQNCKRDLLNSRYDDQIAIFGQEIQEKLSKLNIFMIGAGALGCEYLKNFALMGISCNNGKDNNFITVTDNDNIIMSNLNRQFLYNSSDIGKSKSVCACRETRKFNKNILLNPCKYLLNNNTQEIFDDYFFEKQDIIISAVDKIEARKYIDEKCTFYNKILIDSGTNGTNANFDIYYPNKTICLNDLSFPKKKEIPMCTLKNFPTKIEHCIEWAKNLFLELFNEYIKEIKLIIEDRKKFFDILNEKNNVQLYIKLQKIKYLINIIENPNDDLILQYAVFIFKNYFEFNINELLKEFPTENKIGEKIWDDYRKAPKPLIINYNDQTTKDYFISFYYILSNMIDYKRINYKINIEQLKKIILKENFNLNEKKNNKVLLEEFENDVITRIKKNVNNINQKIIRINPIIFEKDDDENYHINFILSISNLRAKNYQIEQCDFLKAKEISGNIIPAISSTTAAVTGISCMQIYTILQTNNIDFFRCGCFNLGINEYDFFIPEEKRYIMDIPKSKNNPEYKVIPSKFTVWDKIDLFGPNLTINTLVNNFKNKYEFDIDFINYQGKVLFSPLMDEKEDFNKTIEELFTENTGKKIQNNLKYIELKINGSNDDIEILIPKIRYCLRK